jgi:hypothetical protein
MHTRRRSGALLLASNLALMATILVGCSSAAAPPSSLAPTPSAPPIAGQPPTVDPNTSTGRDVPPGAGDPGGVPGAGRIVVPKPGQFDVRPIPAQRLSAIVEGRRVVIAIDYTSGVEPCYVLESILVKTGAGSFAITLREGHAAGDVMCTEQAEFKRALVDLGDLAPGTYTVSDTTGGAAPISVTVS